jgi:hypothetical protein
MTGKSVAQGVQLGEIRGNVSCIQGVDVFRKWKLLFSENGKLSTGLLTLIIKEHGTATVNTGGRAFHIDFVVRPGT